MTVPTCSRIACGLACAAVLACSSAHPALEEAPVSTHPLRLNQVTLPARDLQASIDFYLRFGLRLIVDSPETSYARFEVPGSDTTLSVHVLPGTTANRSPAPQLYFETEHPEALIAQLAERGIEPVEALEDKPWLWREAWFADPAGNRLCVFFAGENRRNPPWRVERPLFGSDD